VNELYEIEVCNCSSLEHHLIFHFDPELGSNDLMFVNMNLNHYLPWYKRILRAVGYVFGRKSRYGDYDEVVLTREQVERIRDRFNFALENMPK
jgi:hypothetical protein